MSWQETIGKNLFKSVEVSIGDNTTKVDNIDGKLKIEHYYKDILQKTENEIKNKCSYLDNHTYTELGKIIGLNTIGLNTINTSLNSNGNIDIHGLPILKKNVSPWTQPWRYNVNKQTYTERELIKNLELIGKHPECIIEKYDTINWTNDIYDKMIDIVDYIYEDYINGGQDGLFFVSLIYNNIIVYIQNDSEISKPYIEYKYVKSQINESDLNTIKKTFNFLNKD